MMKFYFYGLALLCLFCTSSIQAQDNRYWIRAAGSAGNWNDVNNWSTASGGSGGASVPNGGTFNVFFDQGALVNVDLASITLNRMTVSGTTPATLFTSTGTAITLNSGTAGSEGLRIETGSRLEDSCAADVPFSITFANGADGIINGTWYFAGAAGVEEPEGATFELPATTGHGNRVDVNGTIIFRSNTRVPLPGPAVGAEYLFFNSGSEFWLDRNEGGTPEANWDANSTIRLSGAVDVAPIINLTGSSQIGNLIIDQSTLNPLVEPFELGLPSNLEILGNLQVLNTNSRELVFFATLFPGAKNLTVRGNMEVSGATTNVGIAADPDNSFTVQVDGDLNLSGGTFFLQAADGVGANTTMLAIRGDLNHTGGTFTCPSNSQSNTDDLFVVELNGSGIQTITSTGTIDNANNMITLRLNNAAGVNLLSPLAVGKISWNSAGAGVLNTTTANYLTINNPDAGNPTVVNSPSNTGYVSGPVRRITNSTTAYRFPTGKGGVYRFLEVVPNTTASSTYAAEYFNTAHGDPSVLPPLTGVSNSEYWFANLVSGSPAQVQLSLNGAVTGGTAPDAVVIARYNGADWINARGADGTAVTPGNATTGTALTDVLSSFNGFFTFGVGPAGALPVELVSFNAKKLQGNVALVSWTITASSTPDHFEVLRSADGNHFTSIGTVAAVEQKVNYSFTDNNLPAGTSYYRLRMVDVNGEAKLSRIVVVTNGVNGLFLTAMTPTIVTDRARITVSTSDRGNVQLVVTDMFGRVVQQRMAGVESGSQDIWMNMHGLPAGTYNVSGYMNGKRSAVIRFIKQ